MPVALDLDPTPWTDWLGLCVAICTVIGFLGAGIAFLARKRKAHRGRDKAELVAVIREVTQPIQPGYHNGGASNEDQSAMLRDIGAKVDTVIDRQAYISERLDKHLDWHLTKEN